jgi:hypothetical protein
MKKTSAKLKTPARVGKQTLKKSASIKPPKKKRPASAAKKASKGLSSAKTKKPRKRPSGAKAQAVQKRVLSGLRPPLPHQVKSSQSSGLFGRFYDRPDYYIAYGPFYLNHAVHWLKLHHRPEPIDAIKVLKEEIENITQKKSALLLEWGISPEEARRVVESSHRAWLLDFSKRVWGCNEPDQIFSNEKMRERAMIVSAKHDWAQLWEVLGMPSISKQAGLDLTAFLSRLNAAGKENKTGFDAWKFGPADWDRRLIWLWGVNPDQSYIDPAGSLTGKIPPVCLWSGPAIVRYFDLAMDDASVRRQLGRLGLAQTDQSLRFRLEETKHRGKKILRFVR